MKVLAFGDSFVKMFIHCEPEVKHWKFKGKSVRGLVKDDDLQRKRIQKQMRKAPNGTKVLLIFGQVDFNYVRYYKIIKGQPPITEQTFKKYVQWVNSLNFRKNISIISIFASPIKKQFVINSLINKGTYLEEDQTPEIDSKILAQFDKSEQTWYLWNSWISSYCQKYKVNNIRLFQKNNLDPQFYDLSKLTIHLRYVPVLKLVKKFVDISFNAQKAQSIQKQYQMEKTNRIANSNFRINGENQQTQIQIGQNIQRKISEQDQVKVNQNTQKKTIKQTSEDSQNLKQAQLQQLQVPTKNVRKQTADLDTDTNLEKQIEHQKQLKQLQQKEKTNKQSQKNEIQNAKVNGDQQDEDDQKQNKETEADKKNNKKKNTKYKQKKKFKSIQKKKVESSSDSDDEGERFLQYATKYKGKR